MGDTLRLFVALELPGPVLEALVMLQEDLGDRLPGRFVRWVHPDGIHLTLKFLGDAPAAQVDEIVAALNEAVKGHHALALQVVGLGVFPNPKRARVLWAGLTGDVEPLKRLQAAVERHVAPLGYPTESRKFDPHLTLARASRDASRPQQEALGALPAQYDIAQVAAWTVEGVSLMRSQLKPDGAVYTQLAELKLAGKP